MTAIPDKDRAAAYRARQSEKVARMKAALERIQRAHETDEPSKDEEWSLGFNAGLDYAAAIAREALK